MLDFDRWKFHSYSKVHAGREALHADRCCRSLEYVGQEITSGAGEKEERSFSSLSPLHHGTRDPESCVSTSLEPQSI
ncbi:hypothetical protein GN956_G140 [Arapaima gigas]